MIEQPGKRWPRWKTVLAYLVMISIASVSIWFVDRSAMRVQAQSALHVDPSR
ncbi:MAG TPA: hypothetical protein VLI90_12125 [Tepidisphaeraceae bacterium]|nr:hypothetical protein [Tepidisphaeraceae bacterium]